VRLCCCVLVCDCMCVGVYLLMSGYVLGFICVLLCVCWILLICECVCVGVY